MLNFKVDDSKCIKCGACAMECPSRVITMSDNTDLPQVVTEVESKCLGCEHCYALCPVGAISVFGLEAESDSVELSQGVLPSLESMDLLVRARRSVRSYKQENVDPELLQRLLRATANCPTAVNNSALRFDVISDISRMNELRSGIMDELSAYRAQRELPPEFAYLNVALRAWINHKVDVVFRTAPHALFVSAPADNPFCSIIDVSIALSYFELLAQSSGLGTAWCGMLRMSLELLPDYKAKVLTAGSGDYYCMLFGYPDIRFSRTVNRDQFATIRYL